MNNINNNLSFPRNVVGNLPLSKLFTKEEKQPYLMKQAEDPRQKPSGMTPLFNNSGFTLIELLVVVLIIGILAAVALPQYQKAVEKSRAAQALTLLKSVAQAAETYYLANGTEFTSFDELSVEIPWPISNRVVGDDSNQTETLANGQWALEVEHSSLGTSTLFMIRLDGKYKGAGFVVYLGNSTEGHFGTTEIKCYERKSISTVIFDSSLPEGAYCVQIMKGTLALDTQWSRAYTLP